MLTRLEAEHITWARFESCHSDAQVAFENMCRMLFNATFFAGEAIMHSNPNNPGIEVLPLFEKTSEKRISFQAKYLTSPDYSQIDHSADMAIKYYAGSLDILYVYCNRSLTTTSKPYKAIESKLEAAGIQMIPVCNQAILDQVLSDSVIAWSFFDNHILTDEWLQERFNISAASLGPRYNRNFNVETSAEDLLNIFLRNGAAAARINQKKQEILDMIKEDARNYDGDSCEWKSIAATIEEIADISPTTITDALAWPEIVREKCAKELQQLQRLINKKEAAFEQASTNRDKSVGTLYKEINNLKRLMESPDLIALDDVGKKLLENKVLVVTGEAGTGKSQMFANATEQSLKSGGCAILALGGQFLSNDPLESQISQRLGLNCDFNSLLQKMEGFSVQRGTYAYLLIDAVNESAYRNIWKVGLPQLILDIEQFEHVRLAISLRDGYETQVFEDSFNERLTSGTISHIKHRGFSTNTIEATFAFLNYYHIPFCPSYYLEAEMSNPLFLTLFCKYSSKENRYDLFELFEELIRRADQEAQEACGLTGDTPTLKPLVNEIANFRLEADFGGIPQDKLFGLGFWDLYGLAHKKLDYVNALKRADFLIVSPDVASDSEMFYLSYQWLEDYLCAKSILEKGLNKDNLVRYATGQLLRIENGRINNYNNIGVFVALCSLYAEKTHQECFDDIANSLDDMSTSKANIVSRYLQSFVWRNPKSIEPDNFTETITKYHVPANDVFDLLVELSCKEAHPLNAEFLHQMLMERVLVERDRMWTTYINGRTDDEDRLFQLITYLESGGLLDGLSVQSSELLLILFSWTLTSSNRFLRDNVSKAMVELLKKEFPLCIALLGRFEKVNDPYVRQRLFGIVFGACMKRTEVNVAEFRKLAEYVYTSVFDQENVYPDVLLRDYARLIVERYMAEAPDDCDFIDVTKIVPPYHSVAIPTVTPREYRLEGATRSGVNALVWSMCIDHSSVSGMYGDFGRYVFQAALSQFEGIDIVNLYHYAMQFILDELGYSDEQLGAYDSTARSFAYNRHTAKKVERIGKKYQWIALYNILARVADKHLVKEGTREEPHSYEGAWEPYVRDFDPTLNRYTRRMANLPEIELPEVGGGDLLPQGQDFSDDAIRKWTQERPSAFKCIPSKLLLRDAAGHEWVTLNLYDSIESIQFNDSSFRYEKGSQIIWMWAHGCLVSKDDFCKLMQRHDRVCIPISDLYTDQSVYQLFNREYIWSPGCASFLENPWEKCDVEVGPKHTVIEKIEVPELLEDENGDILLMYGGEREIERPEPSELLPVEIMLSYIQVLWEEEYDASQEEATSFYIPCIDIIKKLKLAQKEHDGYYYAPSGDLVCFDGEMSGRYNGLLIRKDYLEQYLEKSGLRLFWTCYGEKQFFCGRDSQKWSTWSGLLSFEDDGILGTINLSE